MQRRNRLQILRKSPSEVERIRVAGGIVRDVLREIALWAQPGVTTLEIDRNIAGAVSKAGGKSAFFGYEGFPANACLSLNEEVIHGVPGARRLQFGDVLKADVGVCFDGMIADGATTTVVGGVADAGVEALLSATERSLEMGISKVRHAVEINEISAAIQSEVESAGFSVVREFVGHGVGRELHEDPKVPNYRSSSSRDYLLAGMTIAIEPMVNRGGAKVKVKKDGWTVVTADGSLSAHFEHTVLVTELGAEILT